VADGESVSRFGYALSFVAHIMFALTTVVLIAIDIAAVQHTLMPNSAAIDVQSLSEDWLAD
jgi:hypothetical protein